jgi:hypothetical protein
MSETIDSSGFILSLSLSSPFPKIFRRYLKGSLVFEAKFKRAIIVTILDLQLFMGRVSCIEHLMNDSTIVRKTAEEASDMSSSWFCRQ